MNSEELASKIPEILEYFGISTLLEGSNKYYGSCPVHCGDHPTGFRLFKHGNVWRCYTHNCHEHFGSSLIGLIRGLLSRKLHNWSNPSDQSVEWRDVYKFIKENLNVDTTPTQQLASFSTDQEVRCEYKISRQATRSALHFPCSFYINRGIDKAILDKYDVGICKNPRKKMFNRAIAPIYDDSYKYSIGCMGRSLYEKCEKCNLYHYDKISCPNPGPYFVKWRNSKFDRSNILYGFWFSKYFILKSKTAILVEGPADIWKLEQAGIHNCVGICGTELTDNQLLKLSKLNIENIVLCLDNDDAGISATKKIVEKTKGLFHIEIPQVCDYNKDIADTSINTLKKSLEKYAKNY